MATQTVVGTAQASWWRRSSDRVPEAFLNFLVQESHKAMRRLGRDREMDSHSTLVALLILGPDVTSIHAGDGRVMRILETDKVIDVHSCLTYRTGKLPTSASRMVVHATHTAFPTCDYECNRSAGFGFHDEATGRVGGWLTGQAEGASNGAGGSMAESLVADLSGPARVIDGDTIEVCGAARAAAWRRCAGERAELCCRSDRRPDGGMANKPTGIAMGALSRFAGRAARISTRGWSPRAGRWRTGGTRSPMWTRSRRRERRARECARTVRGALGLETGRAPARRWWGGARVDGGCAGPLRHQGEYQSQQREAHLPHAQRSGLRAYPGGLTLRLIASMPKSMAMMCFRNTIFEDFHGRIEPVSNTGDFSGY